MINNEDTITAIATPRGNSGVGIIRISGDKAIAIADKIIRSRQGKSLDLFSADTYSAHYGFVYREDKILDEIICIVYKKPGSYTGEDVIEICCHGGMYVLDLVLSLIQENGARLAEPGEFTRRAFLNGRIDLTQAESVMDIISSENEFSRANSMSHLTGSLRNKISEMREKIIHETAFIEAALDDPEHYEIDKEYKSHLNDIVSGIGSEISDILKRSDDVIYLKNGVDTVIAGKPNVGKSSLLNLFLGYDRAIVTSLPGTTRDVISERISIEGLVLNLIDTAGIRNSSDEIESIGIEKTKEQIEKADLVLFLMDASKEPDEEDRLIASLIKEKPCIVILNKTDLDIRFGEDRVEEIIKSPAVLMSVKERIGEKELREKIQSLFIKNEIKDKDIYITNKRQSDSFKEAALSLSRVSGSIKQGMSEDVYTVDLMDAYSRLGEMIGEDISDDLADRIFSEFCMGK